MLRLKRIWEGPKKLKDYLDEIQPKKVGIPFGHGLGDCIMFIEVFKRLASTYPNTEFTLILQKGLGFEELQKDIEGSNRMVHFSSDLSYSDESVDYGFDIIADVDFPMNEGQQELTKGQYCCVHELGIDLEWNWPVYPKLTCGKNRLIVIQFHITCLPGACNPDHDVAQRIWNDVLEAGYIPLEMHFQHVFHNPVNKKFDFVDATCRRVPPRVSTLVGLVEAAAGVISVVTGNLHVSLANKAPERIFFLEKDFKLESFIKNKNIARADVRNYKGEVREWLRRLEALD